MLTKSLSLFLSSAFSINYLSNNSKKGHIYSEVNKTESLLYAWGNGIYGQLGMGAEKISQPIPENVKSLNSNRIQNIYAMYDSSCILTEDNNLHVWGKSKDGAIGLFPGGVSNNIVLPTHFPYSHQIQGKIVQVSLSKEHSALINEAGQLYTWGKDSFGCLAHANKENKKRGGLNISSITCDVASTGDIQNVLLKQVSCGYNYTIALSHNGEVYSWGYGKEGSLGTGSLDNQSLPKKIKGLNNITKITCGSFFCLALSNDGKLYSWGKNNYGQAASGTQKQDLKIIDPLEINLPFKVKDIVAGEDHAALITEDGEAYTWGYGLDGRLGNGNKQNMFSPKKANLPEKINKISCGGNHTAFLGVSGNLYMCGNGRNGELGRGDLLESQSVQRTEPLLVVHFQLTNEKVVDVATGSTHTIALIEKNRKI